MQQNYERNSVLKSRTVEFRHFKIRERYELLCISFLT